MSVTKLFNHILVPVDFDQDTQMIAEKAIGIANEFECNIYWLYNRSPSLMPFLQGDHSSSSLVPNDLRTEDAIKMAGLLSRYRSHLKEGLSMYGEITTGNWFTVMKEFIITHHIDLVIVPSHTKQLFRQWTMPVNVNRLAKQTNCPVLAVTGNMDAARLKNIVVPINDFLPIRKLTTASYIGRRFNSIIHLMGYKKHFHEKEPSDTKWLGRAYQLLKDHTHLKVYRSSSYGHSVAGNTLSYAKKVEADLIVVNPKESLPGSWISYLFGRSIYSKSDIPVLTIARQYGKS